MPSLLPYDEKALLSAVTRGDEAAFRCLYEHYHVNIYHYVLSLLKSPQLAEDVRQEVFAKIWEARATLPRVEAFGPYLFTTARNHTINVLKSATRSQAAMGEVLRHIPDPRYDDSILDRDYDRFIQRVLDKVPSRTRQLYRQCKEEGKTYEEAARELGISGNAVKRHVINAVRALRDAAGKDLGMTTESAIIIFFSIVYLT